MTAFAFVGCASTDPDASEIEGLATANDPLICGESDIVQGQCSNLIWPNGVIPYRFDLLPIAGCPGGSWSIAEMDKVRANMAKWTTATAGKITFLETTDASAVRIHKSDGGGWFRTVGYGPGGHGCANPNDDWNTLHELGHLIGLQHEMVRNDRDRYTAISPVNACPPVNDLGYWNIAVRCGQDRIMTGTSGSTSIHGDRSDYGPYNIVSLMQYGTSCRAGTCTSSFTGCTNGICDIILRGGGNLPPNPQPWSVTAQQGASVVEMYAEAETWQRFRPSPTSDPGPTSPLNFDITPGVLMSGSPAVVRWKDETWAAVRAGNQVYIKANATKIGPWTLHADLTFVTSDPALATRKQGTVLQLAAVRLTNPQVRLNEFTDAGGWVSQGLGVPTGVGAVSAPAIASCLPDLTSVFVIRDNRLWEKYFNGTSWSTWTLRSDAELTGKPSAVGFETGRIDLVAARLDGSVAYYTYFGCNLPNGSAISGPGLTAPGMIRPGTSPAIASHTFGTLSVFAAGANGVLFERKATFPSGNIASTWGTWAPIGGYFDQTSPAATGGIVDNNTRGLWLAANVKELTPMGTSKRGLWTRMSATCPGASGNGGGSFCSELCPCNEAQGDCDDETTGADCVGNLVCGHDFGGRYGMTATFDVCVDPGCLLPGGAATCHKDCPCGVGGACAQHEDCAPRFICTAGQCAPAP